MDGKSGTFWGREEAAEGGDVKQDHCSHRWVRGGSRVGLGRDGIEIMWVESTKSGLEGKRNVVKRWPWD